MQLELGCKKGLISTVTPALGAWATLYNCPQYLFLQFPQVVSAELPCLHRCDYYIFLIKSTYHYHYRLSLIKVKVKT